LSSSVCVDDEITSRLAKASAAFGRLTRRLWSEHGIQLRTKVAVYRAVVLTALLYGCEMWTMYRRHIVKLDQFHMRCLRKKAHVKWQDMIPSRLPKFLVVPGTAAVRRRRHRSPPPSIVKVPNRYQPFKLTAPNCLVPAPPPPLTLAAERLVHNSATTTSCCKCIYK
jgi:hypothetical protein